VSPLASSPAAPAWRPLTVHELHSLGVVLDMALQAANEAHRDTLQSPQTGVWLIMVREAREAAQLIIQDDILRRPAAWKEHVAMVEREAEREAEDAAELADSLEPPTLESYQVDP